MADGRVTYFVVLAYERAKGRRAQLVPLDPYEAPNAEAARRRAARYGDAGGGGLAFSRTGDPDSGEWDDAIILGQFGELPANVMEEMEQAA